MDDAQYWLDEGTTNVSLVDYDHATLAVGVIFMGGSTVLALGAMMRGVDSED